MAQFNVQKSTTIFEHFAAKCSKFNHKFLNTLPQSVQQITTMFEQFAAKCSKLFERFAAKCSKIFGLCSPYMYVKPRLLAITLDDCAVCDQVGLDALCRHRLKQGSSTMHFSTACTSVNERIVCDSGELQLLGQ